MTYKRYGELGRVQSKSRNTKKKKRDWTEPAHLSRSDWRTLKEIKRLHKQKKMREAMSVASDNDTIVREEIPPQIWLDMGGKLTSTGMEKLRQSKMKNKKSGEPNKTQRGKKASLVETISESVKLLRRFRNMVNKTIPTQRLYSFIKSLQKAIHERRIRKSDSYSSQIEVAQRLAVQAYQKSFGKSTEVKAPQAFVDELSEIGKSEKVRPSVAFLKRFVALVGQPWHTAMKKIRQLIETLEFMKQRNMITESDPYYEKVKQAERVLTLANNKRDRITVPAQTLQGLNGIIEREVQSTDLAGLDSLEHEDTSEVQETEKVRTAKQEAERVYDKFPFTGYYEKLLGSPERNFWMVIYGLPFQGKTTFSVGFAKYLAENMGNVLYVSAEQFGSDSLRQVIQNVGAADLSQLHFAKSLDDVESLEPYDIVFVDSATAANMTIDDVQAWRELNDKKAIVTILQSTKGGDFRGAQFWRHLPSIVVKIDDRKAEVEKNQHGNGALVTLPLPKLVKQNAPATVDESLEGHKKGNRETLVVGCGYMASIPGIQRMINETPESVQRMLKATPEKIAAKLVKVLERRCEKLGARVRIEDFILTDTDTIDNVNGTVFFHCNVRGRLAELKKVIDDWGGHIFVAMQDVPWE